MNSSKIIETLGYIIYAVSPNRTTFEKIEDVPDYHVQAVPVFFIFWFLEHIIFRMKTDPYQLSDAVESTSQGVLSEIMKLFTENWKLAAYIYIYSNWRIFTLPWDSLWTWWIAFFMIDFLYYWGHRASHEINFLWAIHQVHHSSEEYNFSTALRQSAFQNCFLSLSYLPLALAVPPTSLLVHTQLNFLYQFWIHTRLVKSLGPLEYVLNTASHHRVHHGRNRYCIDKNYAGVLIIWDRMFGTFEPEKEEVVYGLTHPINTFEPFYIQFSHFLHIWRTFWSTEGWINKLSVIFKGPGWSPGKPRLGNIEDIPDVKAPVEKYNPYLPEWCKVYVLYHLLILVAVYVEMAEGKLVIPPAILYCAMIYVIFSLSVLGIFLDARPYAAWLELLRCLFYLAVDYYFIPWTRISMVSPAFQIAILALIRVSFLASGIVWLRHCGKSITIRWHSVTKKLK